MFISAFLFRLSPQCFLFTTEGIPKYVNIVNYNIKQT